MHDFTVANYVINEQIISEFNKDKEDMWADEVTSCTAILPNKQFYNRAASFLNANKDLIHSFNGITEAEDAYFLQANYYIHQLWKDYIKIAGESMSIDDIASAGLGVYFMPPKQEAINEIKARLSPFTKVQSVYFTEYQNALCFKVFLNTKHYDRVLTRKLIEIETEVEDNYPDFDFDFAHIPLPHVPKETVLTGSYKKVFER